MVFPIEIRHSLHDSREAANDSCQTGGGSSGGGASGREIVSRDVVTSRFRDGLIAEEWVISDLEEQLLLSRKK